MVNLKIIEIRKHLGCFLLYFSKFVPMNFIRKYELALALLFVLGTTVFVQSFQPLPIL
jgi:hypothetical protein